MAKTFVLIAGAWHGAWCWKETASALRQMGHAVYTPELTGLGELASELDQHISIETHVNDAVRAWETYSLSDGILCVHSYAGMLGELAGARLGERLKAIVYIDAFAPENGQSMEDFVGKLADNPAMAADLKASGGVCIGPPPVAMFDLDPQNFAWVALHLTPHPARTLQEPIELPATEKSGYSKIFIRASNSTNPALKSIYDKLCGMPGWQCAEVAGGHDVMIEHPQKLAALLDQIT